MNKKYAPFVFLLMVIAFILAWGITRKKTTSEEPTNSESKDAGSKQKDIQLNLPSETPSETSKTQNQVESELIVQAQKSDTWIQGLLPLAQKSYVGTRGEAKNLSDKILKNMGPEDDPAPLTQFFVKPNGEAIIWDPLSKENEDFGGFLPNGEILKKSSVKLPGREFRNYEGTFDVRSYEGGLSYTGFYKTYAKGKDGTMKELPGIPLVRAAGRFVRVALKGDNRFAVVLNANSRVEFDFPINSQADTLKTFFSDTAQNIYAVFTHYENGKALYIIEKYAYSGEKQEKPLVIDAGSFEIPIENPIRITENGVVYAKVIRGKDVTVEEHRFSK